MKQIKLPHNIVLTAENNMLCVYKDGVKRGCVSKYLHKPLYITLSGTKPVNNIEAEERAGIDVFKIENKQLLKYEYELGLWDNVDDDYAYFVLKNMLFDIVFDSNDKFAYVLKMQLTLKEWNAVKIYFFAEENEYITHDTKKVIDALVSVSERFKDAFAFALFSTELNVKLEYHSLVDYVKHYTMKDRVIDCAYEDSGLERMKGLYGFHGTLKKIYSHGSLSMYNTGTIEVEYRYGKTLIVLSYAIPPDDYGIEVTVAAGKVEDVNTAYILNSICHVKKDIEWCRILFDLRQSPKQ